jgi:hypothetical protein
MKRLISRFAWFVATSLLLPASVHAQVFRTYLASYGNDANPCTAAAPCRLLPAALALVASNGEIWILDSANFNAGPVTIDKNVSIMAVPGQIGSVVAASGGAAITLSGPVSLRLRNLFIVNNAVNPGTYGIVMSAGSLVVEDSVIAASPSYYGIYATGGAVSVLNVTFRDSFRGIVAKGNTNVMVTNSRFTNLGGYGVHGNNDVAGTTTQVTVADSSFANLYVGIVMDGGNATSIVKGSVTRCTFANITYGVAAEVLVTGSQAVISTSNSIFSGTTAGFFNFNGVNETLGNNTVRNNAATNAGTATGDSSF